MLTYLLQLWDVPGFEEAVDEGLDTRHDEDSGYEARAMREALVQLSELGSLKQLDCVRALLATMEIPCPMDIGKPTFTDVDWAAFEIFFTVWQQRAEGVA